MSAEIVSAGPARPGLWAGLFAVNMALIAVFHILDFIEQPVPFILFALNMTLLVPWARAATRMAEQRGMISPALRRYNRRVLGVMAAYMVAMIGSGELHGELPPGSPWLWLLAAAPLLPLMGMIWTMVRYYREEEDEYLRHRATLAALTGLVLVLVVGTAWGFLEMFGLVPHVWSWWVFPVWSIGMGLARCLPERAEQGS